MTATVTATNPPVDSFEMYDIGGYMDRLYFFV